QWWKDQRKLWGDKEPLSERALRVLLGLLACALGPLSRDDVLRLAPPDAGLDSLLLDETLRPLERFVVGGGRRQGYAFSHPLLREYFYEQLTEGERRATGARFLAWGEETLAALNQGALSPERAAPYVLQYYGAHLERAQAGADALRALVSAGW